MPYSKRKPAILLSLFKSDWCELHLLVLGEVNGVQVGGCCIGRGVDLLCADVQAQAGKLSEVALARLGGVVRHKDQLLALRQLPVSVLFLAA